MYMSSNIGSVAYSSREGIINVPEDQRVYYFQPVAYEILKLKTLRFVKKIN